MLREALAAKFMRQHAVGKDENSVGDGGRLSRVTRAKENDPPRLCEAPHDSMHLTLSAHIDASGRVIEYKQ